MFLLCVIQFSFDYIQKYHVNKFANDASELQGEKKHISSNYTMYETNTQVNKHWWCIAMQHCLHIQWLTVSVDSGSLNKNNSNLEDFGNVVVFVFINVWSCITGIPECFCLEISKVNIALTCRYMKKKLFIYTEYISISTVEVKSLHAPCRICKMLIVLPSKRDHTKCMLLFI